MALYEVLEDGTIVPKAGKTVGNLGCLRTEVVYDKNSSDSNKNWGYTRGIKGGVTVSGKDFSKYSQLKIYVNSTNIQYIYEMDLTTKAYKYVVVEALSEYPYVTGSSSPAYDAPANDMRSICAVSDDKTKFYHFTTGYNNGATYTERNDYGYYYIYKIEGILKEPAMIYTGKELFAGNGISVKDGVVSSNVPHFYGSYSFTSNQSVAGTSSTTATKTIATYTTGSLAKGKYLCYITGVVKVSQFTGDIRLYVDGVQACGCYTNLTSFVGVSGMGYINLEEGTHTVTVVLASRGTVTMQSYNTGCLFMIRVGD